jgi:hypothetical protein
MKKPNTGPMTVIRGGTFVRRVTLDELFANPGGWLGAQRPKVKARRQKAAKAPPKAAGK